MSNGHVVSMGGCEDLTAKSPGIAPGSADNADAELAPSGANEFAAPAADAWSKHQFFLSFKRLLRVRSNEDHRSWNAAYAQEVSADEAEAAPLEVDECELRLATWLRVGCRQLTVLCCMMS